VADNQGDLSWEGRRARTTVIQSYYDRKGQGGFGIAKPLSFPYSAAFPSMGLYNIVRLSTHWVMIQPTPGLDTERLI